MRRCSEVGWDAGPHWRASLAASHVQGGAVAGAAPIMPSCAPGTESSEEAAEAAEPAEPGSSGAQSSGSLPPSSCDLSSVHDDDDRRLAEEGSVGRSLDKSMRTQQRRRSLMGADTARDMCAPKERAGRMRGVSRVGGRPTTTTTTSFGGSTKLVAASSRETITLHF